MKDVYLDKESTIVLALKQLSSVSIWERVVLEKLVESVQVEVPYEAGEWQVEMARDLAGSFL